MNEELLTWNLGLLFAAWCGLMGLTGEIFLTRKSDRSFAGGLLLLGVVLFFVVASVHFERRPDLRVGGSVVAGLLVIRELIKLQSDADQSVQGEKTS